jgi:hypothetical protein
MEDVLLQNRLRRRAELAQYQTEMRAFYDFLGIRNETIERAIAASAALDVREPVALPETFRPIDMSLRKARER